MHQICIKGQHLFNQRIFTREGSFQVSPVWQSLTIITSLIPSMETI
jgi:hypothetical protein